MLLPAHPRRRRRAFRSGSKHGPRDDRDGDALGESGEQWALVADEQPGVARARTPTFQVHPAASKVAPEVPAASQE